MAHCPHQDTLVARLDADRIRYVLTPTGTLEVLEDLWLEGSTLRALPEGLHVRGWLSIRDTTIATLPSTLTVDGHFYLDQTPITTLPAGISVGEYLRMNHSQVSSLPEGLIVPGGLQMKGTPIRTLPHGLVVGEGLDLDDTPIERFPADLRVGQHITPPPRLHDVQAFMATQDHDVAFHAPRTQHERLHVQARLQRFPDLLRVVQALPRMCRLDLRRSAAGGHEAILIDLP